MIVGAMKAGTSALFSALAKHPDILGSINKEPGFWIKDGAPQRGQKGYMECWDRGAKPNAKWLLEGSTHYTKVPMQRSPARYIRRIDGEVRFIYVTRDPVARVRSQYEMSLAHGWFANSIEKGLEPASIWFSNYYMQIRPFIDCFGTESICVLSHEELRRDPKAALLRVGEFLGVDPSGLPDQLPRVNVASEHRTIRAAALRKSLRESMGTEAYQISDEELQRRLAAEVTPTEEHIAKLHEELDADLARFEEIFGLDPWTGERTVQQPVAVQETPASPRMGASAVADSPGAPQAPTGGSELSAALASMQAIRREARAIAGIS